MPRLNHRFAALTLAGSLLAPALVMAQTTPSAEARKLLDGFSGEPTVNEVQQAALSYFAMHPEELASLKSRAGWSALLPKATIEVTKELDDSSRSTSILDEDPTTASKITALEQKDDDLELRARGEWQLNELVFSPDELAVLRESRLTAKERQKLLQTVTRTYFERRRAQVDLLTAPPADAKGRALAELKIAELTAELDSLTGGAFSRMASGGR
jgi:hypothetical protein